jgi:hypothetical protein
MEDDDFLRIVGLALRWQIEELADTVRPEGLNVLVMAPGMKRHIDSLDFSEYGVIVRAAEYEDYVKSLTIEPLPASRAGSLRNLVLVTLPTRPIYGSDRRLNVAAQRISSLLWNYSHQVVRALVVSHDYMLLQTFMDHMEYHELIREFDHVVKWGEEEDLVLASRGSMRTIEGWIIDQGSLMPKGRGVAHIGVVDLQPVGH